MSEEEIIKDVKDFNNITVLYGQLVLLKSQLTRYQKASNNLLDLYNKEKEQNSLIKNKLKELNIPMETLIGEFDRLEDLEDDREQLKWRLKEEKEKNKELYDKNMKMALNGGSFEAKHYIENNYIHKDKIKAKIEELKNDEKNIREKKKNSYDYDRSSSRLQAYLTKTKEMIKRLEELLEEK